MSVRGDVATGILHFRLRKDVVQTVGDFVVLVAMRLRIGLQHVTRLRHAGSGAVPRCFQRRTTEGQSGTHVVVDDQTAIAVFAARLAVIGVGRCSGSAARSRGAAVVERRSRRGSQLIVLAGNGEAAGVDRFGHVERVGLVTVVGGEDDARTVGVHAQLLRSGFDGAGRGVSRFVEAVQTVLTLHRRGDDQHRCRLGLHDVRIERAVVDVRHCRQHVLQIVQAVLDERIGRTVDVHAGITVDDVQTVVHVVRPGDLGQLAAVALTQQVQREVLVVATPVVINVPDNLGTVDRGVDLVEFRLGAGDGQLAAAHFRIFTVPADLGTGAIGVAGEGVLGFGIVRAQHAVIREGTKISYYVVDLAQVFANR